MATASKSCGVCELRHITKASKVWCTECDQGLCTECHEHHSLSKASRSHSVIPFTEYQKLPADVLKFTQYCTKHDKKYQIYCQKHECPCCSKCIVESHTECRDFVELDDVIHNVKTSNAMCELEETLVEVAENLQKIRQNQQDNLTKFKESRKGIETEIKRLEKDQRPSRQATRGFDEKTLCGRRKRKLQNMSVIVIIRKAGNRNSRMSEKHSEHKATCNRPSSLSFHEKIEADVYSKNKFIQSLEEDKIFTKTSLSYKINTSIQNIMSDIISFGDVRIEAKSCDIVITRKKAKQAQMMVQTVQSRPIENITLTKLNTINTKGNSIFGCCMFLDGRMAFTYHSDSKVIVFNMKGLKDFEVKMPFYPYSIVFISEDNTLAVTSGHSQTECITIIDLKKKQIKKTISLDSLSYGIALRDNRLIYSAEDKGIRMVNLSDESISDVVRDKMAFENNIATFRDNIYNSNNETDTVTCYNLQGEIQWTFQNESVLIDPRGIDVDNDGNVYVVGLLSNNVVVISPNGQQHREILTASDGLSGPMSLHYSRPQNQLLVANFHEKAHLFNIN